MKNWFSDKLLLIYMDFDTVIIVKTYTHIYLPKNHDYLIFKKYNMIGNYL